MMSEELGFEPLFSQESLMRISQKVGKKYKHLIKNDSQRFAELSRASRGAVLDEVEKPRPTFGRYLLAYLGVSLFASFLIGLTSTQNGLISGFVWFCFAIVGTIVIVQKGTKKQREYDEQIDASIAFTAVCASIVVNKRIDEARKRAQETPFRKKKRGPLPHRYPNGVTHEEAEHLVCSWMKYLGEIDARVTRFVGDGGIDIESMGFVVQVKNYKGSVPVADIRSLQGVASADGRKPIFFTSGSFTKEGEKFATSVKMPLIRYNAIEGSLEALNPPAEVFLSGF